MKKSTSSVGVARKVIPGLLQLYEHARIATAVGMVAKAFTPVGSCNLPALGRPGRDIGREASEDKCRKQHIGLSRGESAVVQGERCEVVFEYFNPLEHASGRCPVCGFFGGGVKLCLPERVRSGGVVVVFEVAEVAQELECVLRRCLNDRANGHAAFGSDSLPFCEVVALEPKKKREKGVLGQPVGAIEVRQIFGVDPCGIQK